MTDKISISKCSCGHINLHFGCATYHIRPCDMHALLIDIGFKDRELLQNALVLSLNSEFYLSQMETHERKVLLRFGMNLVELKRNELLEFVLQCWQKTPEIMHRAVAESMDDREDFAWMA